MIKLTIYPGRANAITDAGWDYLRSIGKNISEKSAEYSSLTDYAISFSQFASNIEIDRVFHVSYFDGIIKLYSTADWAERHVKQPYPIATLELDKLSY